MSFDTSRATFRPRKNFLGVVMQQGRVQSDSDWNEWQSEFLRRIQAGTLDEIGRAVYPASTPNAFRITPGTDANGGNTLAIGAGRYYVDGLLAENHGPEAQASWDTALAELSGAPAFSPATAATDFTKQPWLPNAALPTGNGPFLAYLDVWLRDITYLEDPDLIDKAINIDTTGRLQNIWQVKLLDLSNTTSAPDCSTDIPAFDALETPPAGRLTNGLVPNAGTGPCCLAPNTGYTGQENQNYRVEIHRPGTPATPPANGFNYPFPAGTPTFKWSRDNASVITSVSAIATVTTATGPVSQITVASLGRDQVLGFAVNDWIEITDDAYELNGQAGELFQITAVIAASRTITLNGVVSGHFPLTNGQTDPKLHTRICRWDQSGKVYKTDSSGNTTLWIDLNAPGSTGDIPVPPSGTILVLESGITVAFDLNPAPTTANPTVFRVADYWTFAARTADGSIEQLTAAPPFGIHHHYARLAIVTFPGKASDCRIEWPPNECACNCACSVTISPTDVTGNNTLQSIVDKYKNQSSLTTICLEAGTYQLPAPLRLSSAHANLTIAACLPGNVRIVAQSGNEAQFNDGLIVLDNAQSITLSGLNFVVPVSLYSPTSFAGLPINSLSASVVSMVQSLAVSIGIRIVNASNISVTKCAFSLGSFGQQILKENVTLFSAAIFTTGQNTGFHIEGNQFIAQVTKRLPTAQSFLTGFLLSSNVSFGTPPPPIQTPAATAPAKTQQQVPQATKAAPTAAIPKAGQEAAISREIIDTNIGDSGVQITGGLLQNLGGFVFIPPTLASQGGKVLAATLDNSVFRGNTFLHLNIAAFLLGEPGNLDTSANQVADCRAGFWIVTPANTQALLTDPENLALLGATIALSYPLPQGDSSTPVTVAPAPAATRIYTGVNNYTDSSKNLWIPDVNAKNVTISGGALSHPVPPPAVTGTNDPALYQSERFGAFNYTFNNLPAGFYSLTLKFAEIFYTNNQTNKGVRAFNITINGQPVLTNFDIVADIGGALFADDKTFAGIAPNSASQIVVQFTGATIGTDHNPKISAAELDALWTGAPYLGTGNESDSASFFDQLAQLAWQSYATLGFSTTQLRIQNNEMRGLTALGVLVLGGDSVANGNSGTLIMNGNHIEGLIELDSDFANFSERSRYIPRLFAFLVGVIQVSRSVVSANIVTNGDPVNGYGASLYLNDLAVQQAAISVMNNVLAGGMLVSPVRNLFDPNLDAYVQSWNFLNTIVT
jgi:Family of unknown function (DUF6519)/Malectin domain